MSYKLETFMINKYLVMAVLLALGPAAHALDCGEAFRAIHAEQEAIAGEAAQLNVAQAQYDQYLARSNNFVMQLQAIDQEMPLQQGFASQLQLLMQALDALKGDFSPAKVQEAVQAFEQFSGFEAAVAPARALFDQAIKQTSYPQQQFSLGLTMDKLGQVIEAQSANIFSLEKARAQVDMVFQQESQEGSKLFKTTGDLGASIIRHQTKLEEAQRSLPGCQAMPRLPPLPGHMGGRF
jgi:hypothetical protein